jgi:hypothetical protein
MPQFIVRVELKGSPSGSDYGALHQAMGAAFYKRTIIANGGTVYHLPHAEYAIISDLTVEKVAGHAKGIADTVWAAGSYVLAVEMKGWYGYLEPETPA